VGTDPLGEELLEYLAARKLETQYIQRDSVNPTGRVTVDTRDPANPSFIIHEDSAWDYLEFNTALRTLMGRAAAVCFGTLAQRNEPSRETIHRCLAAAETSLRVYDVNLRQQWYRRDWIERSLRAAHVVKLNEDEARILADLLELDGSSPEHFAVEMRNRFQVDLVCITRSDKGCLLFNASESIEIAGVPVQVEDAVGAGDAFTAALISGLLRGWPLRTTGTFANRVGALVASRPGAMPDLQKEYAEWIAQI